jgi:hypothetical protein
MWKAMTMKATGKPTSETEQVELLSCRSALEISHGGTRKYLDWLQTNWQNEDIFAGHNVALNTGTNYFM